MIRTKDVFAELRQQLNEAAEAVENGDINPFEFGRELSATKKSVEEAKDKVSRYEFLEYSKYDSSELKKMKIQVSGGGYTWDFKHIPEWVEQKAKLDAIEEKAKNAYLALQKNNTLFDNNDGTEVTPAHATPKKQSITYR